MTNGHETGNPIAKKNDRETATKPGLPPRRVDTENETNATLPVGHSSPRRGAIPDSPVMWAEPGALASGPRSGGSLQPVAQVIAGGVTVGEAASQPQPAGAARAIGGLEGHAKLAPPGLPQAGPRGIEANNAIETGVANEAGSSTVPSASKISPIDASKPVTGLNVGDRDYAFEVVRQARQIVAGDEASRAARKDTNPSPKTIADYEKKCRIVDAKAEALAEPSGPAFEVVLAEYAVKKQTFFAMKAALRWRALTQLRQALSAQDSYQRVGDFSDKWWQLIEALRSTILQIELLDVLDRSELLEIFEYQAKLAKSKRDDLRYLPGGWQERFLEVNERSATYRLAGVVLRFTGLRPKELETGVQISSDGDQILVRIDGAKVRATAGQPWRMLALAKASLPAWFVDDVESAGTLRVQAFGGAMRTHLKRISEKVFGAMRRKVTLSAYHFRHALVTDLREEEWTAEEIAAAIGESAQETVSWYGQRSRTRTKRPRLVAIARGSVEAARPVRQSDPSGLRHVLNLKTQRLMKPK